MALFISQYVVIICNHVCLKWNVCEQQVLLHLIDKLWHLLVLPKKQESTLDSWVLVFRGWSIKIFVGGTIRGMQPAYLRFDNIKVPLTKYTVIIVLWSASYGHIRYVYRQDKEAKMVGTYKYTFLRYSSLWWA